MNTRLVLVRKPENSEIWNWEFDSILLVYESNTPPNSYPLINTLSYQYVSFTSGLLGGDVCISNKELVECSDMLTVIYEEN